MTDAPKTIHAAFARELVQVCRKHGMNSLSANYRAGFRTDAETEFSGMVTVSWAEGRHGVNGRISLRFEGTDSFSEKKDEAYG